MKPGFAELISTETRKIQNKLLLIAFAVILLASKAVTVSGTAKENGFEVTISIFVLLAIGLLAVAYFELLSIIRSYADWRLYKIKNAAASRELDGILHSLFKEKGKYQLPFEHTAASYYIDKPGANPERRFETNKRKGLEYNEDRKRSKDRRAWFIDNNLALVSARRLKFMIEIALPIMVGAIAICMATMRMIGG